MDRWNDTVYVIYTAAESAVFISLCTHIGRCRGASHLLSISLSLFYCYTRPFSRPSFLTFFLPSFQPAGFRFLHLFLIDPGIRSNPPALKAQTIFQKQKSQYVKANSRLVNSSLPYLYCSRNCLSRSFFTLAMNVGVVRGERCWSYITGVNLSPA